MLQQKVVRFYQSEDEQEIDRLKDAINRTDTEKFQFLTNLIKMQRLIKKSAVHKAHQQDTNELSKTYLSLFKWLNHHHIRYIVAGELAALLHGHEYFTGHIDLYIEDTPDDRKKIRQAYADYGMGDCEVLKRPLLFPVQ